MADREQAPSKRKAGGIAPSYFRKIQVTRLRLEGTTRPVRGGGPHGTPQHAFISKQKMLKGSELPFKPSGQDP